MCKVLIGDAVIMQQPEKKKKKKSNSGACNVPQTFPFHQIGRLVRTNSRQKKKS